MSKVEISSKRELYLDIARTLAIICITLNHAIGCTYDKNSGQYAEFMSISLLSTIIKVFSVTLSNIGVPLFLMITGVLILNKKMDDEASIKRFYRHNLLSLFITAEIWYVIMFLFRNIVESRRVVQTLPQLPDLLFDMVKTMLFINQDTYGHMWYMPMILCIYTTIPFLIIIKELFPAVTGAQRSVCGAPGAKSVFNLLSVHSGRLACGSGRPV